MSIAPDDDRSSSYTSVQVRRAIDGDTESLAWIIERFSPVLLAQARFRLGSALRRFYDPEDLVADVWGVVLRRVSDLRVAAESNTGTLIRYLGTVLLRRVRDLSRLAAVRQAANAAAEPGQEGGAISQVDASTTSIVTRAIRHEQSELLQKAIESLEHADRQVIILRGIEGCSLAETAAVMQSTPGAIATRYHRALKRLKEAFPESVLAELSAD